MYVLVQPVSRLSRNPLCSKDIRTEKRTSSAANHEDEPCSFVYVSKVPSERVSLAPGPCTNGYDVTPTYRARCGSILDPNFQDERACACHASHRSRFSLSAVCCMHYERTPER